MPKLKQYDLKDSNCDPNDTQLFTTKDLAQKLNMCVTTLQRLRIRGGGPRFIKLTSNRTKVLYDWKDVVAYLESHKCTSTSDIGDQK